MGGEVRNYTMEDASRKLRLSSDRVRQMLEDGEIEGTRARVEARATLEQAEKLRRVPGSG